MTAARQLALALAVAATALSVATTASPAAAAEMSATAPRKARVAPAPRRPAMPPLVRMAQRYEAMLRRPCAYGGCHPYYALIGVGYQW